MSSCGWSGNMTFLCCRMKGGRMRLFSPLGFRRAPCPDMFPGMWHNLGTIRASAEACGACQRTLWQLRAAVKTNKQVLLLRAGAEGGALVDFSHAALTLTSLLSALSCSAGQCQHRQSVARVFFLLLPQAKLAVRPSGWMEIHSDTAGRIWVCDLWGKNMKIQPS